MDENKLSGEVPTPVEITRQDFISAEIALLIDRVNELDITMEAIVRRQGYPTAPKSDAQVATTGFTPFRVQANNLEEINYIVACLESKANFLTELLS